MSSQTTICARRVCANAGRMNDLKLENSGVGTNALLQLQNTNGDANGPIIKLMKNPSDGGSANSDTCGVIQFHSLDSGAESTQFAEITASIANVTATDEAGKLELKVAESDGTDTAITTGLSLTGSSTVDGQVNVTLGAGASSVVSIPGSLTQPIVLLGTTGTIDLTEASHAGRILHVTDTTGAVTYTVPNPTSTDIFYRLVYVGKAITGHNVVIKRAVDNTGTDGSVFLGNILTTKRDEAGAGDTKTIFADGALGGGGTDTLTMAAHESFDITLRCTTVFAAASAPGVFTISGFASGTAYVAPSDS